MERFPLDFLISFSKLPHEYIYLRRHLLQLRSLERHVNISFALRLEIQSLELTHRAPI